MKNLVERGILIGKGQTLTPQDLGIDRQALGADPTSFGLLAPFPPIPKSGVNLTELQRAMEKYYLDEAYKMAGGNESKAAKLLNINHHTYRYRRKKLLEE